MSKDQVKDELVKIFKTSLTAEVVHCFITTVLFRVAKRSGAPNEDIVQNHLT